MTYASYDSYDGWEENEMSSGREHYERRIAQQRAADKRRVKRREDIDWRKDQQ